MTALDESTHRPSEQPVWRQGTLSDDEFERAALAISPSWELGLDVAPLSAPPPSAVTVGAFVAPSAAVSSVLVAASAEAAANQRTASSGRPKDSSISPAAGCWAMIVPSGRSESSGVCAPSLRSNSLRAVAAP